jgi:hypothetical protein
MRLTATRQRDHARGHFSHDLCRGVRLIVGLLVGATIMASSPTTAAPLDVNREIRPLLSRNCFACHGPDEHDRQGGLRLDDRDAAITELDSGETAIVPGKPDASEMVARIRSTDPDLVMPPPSSLPRPSRRCSLEHQGEPDDVGA